MEILAMASSQSRRSCGDRHCYCARRCALACARQISDAWFPFALGFRGGLGLYPYSR